MEVNDIIEKLKEYAGNQIDSLAKTNPFVNLTRPFINRIINNTMNKADKMLRMLADENGSVNIEELIDEMIESVINSKSFNIHASVLGDISIGEGKIVLNMPFTDKNIIFNKEDFDKLRETLINEKHYG